MNTPQTADARGLLLTGIGAHTADEFESLINDSYYYKTGVQDRLDALLSNEPEFGMGHVFKGYSLMTEGLVGSHADAAAHLRQAEALPATPRERLHQEALRAWIAQDSRTRGLAWEEVLARWPLDLLAFRQHTGTLFWMGNKRHQALVAASISSHWLKGIPGRAHFLSAYSFAMEETGHYAEAERASREALEHEPQDLWALHALAHVHEMLRRRDEGISLLENAAGFLNNYNLFRGHLWWHLAMFKYSEAGYDEVLELLDREIYPKVSSFYLDIQNAVSLLVRLELQGVAVGAERWERLAQGALQTATQNTVWFTTLHHVLALLRTGRSAAVNETLAYANAHAAAGSEQARLASKISEAAVSHAKGAGRDALDRLLSLRQEFGQLGASHVQQDLYQQVMISAAVQAGDWPRIRQLLKERSAARIYSSQDIGRFTTLAGRIDEMQSIEDVRAEFRR